MKAYLRAGHAKLGLQQPNNAADMFRQALNLDASSAAAQVSFVSATAASNAQSTDHIVIAGAFCITMLAIYANMHLFKVYMWSL